MRFPARPPSQDEIWKQFAHSPGRLRSILEQVPAATSLGRYLHWDKLRHLKPPEGLSHREWWFGLKLRRMGLNRAVALRDTRSANFSYSVIDPLPEALHHIDLSAGGLVQIPEPVINPDTKDRYLVRSLIEEAITSSQLEGAATTREVAKEMLREGRAPRDRSEMMILNNYHTMQRIASMKNEPLTKDLVFELHRMATTDTLNNPSGAGRFRHSGEQIAVTNQQEEVLHNPPPAAELEERMQTMCDFANGSPSSEFIHPAIRSIILHFWLAYDHPFVDGNGRTARALFYWSMLHHGYWLCEFISISEIILRAPAKYGRAFLYTETDDNDLTYFIIYHTDVIRKAIRSLQNYVELRSRQLRALELELRGIAALNHRQRDLVSHALRHPGQHYSIESHRSSQNVVYETARTDLLGLVSRGLFQHLKQKKTHYFVPFRDLEERLRKLA